MAIRIGKGIPVKIDYAIFKVFWFKLFVKHVFDNILINENDCWIWQGYIYWNNTTNFGLKAWKISARRASYMTFINIEIPDGYVVKSKCKNFKCVNPDHLYLEKLGVNLQRARDAKYKICKVDDRR